LAGISILFYVMNHYPRLPWLYHYPRLPWLPWLPRLSWINILDYKNNKTSKLQNYHSTLSLANMSFLCQLGLASEINRIYEDVLLLFFYTITVFLQSPSRQPDIKTNCLHIFNKLFHFTSNIFIEFIFIETKAFFPSQILIDFFTTKL
jgi:hypothetical protein